METCKTATRYVPAPVLTPLRNISARCNQINSTSCVANCASEFTATWKSPMPQGEHRPLVSQAFCSALPVAYTNVPPSHWEAFASLVLQAAYEATMWAAVLNAQRGASNVVLLTQLGGGAFGNHDDWINAAMRRSLEMMLGFDLDVRLVSYGTPSRAILQMAKDFDSVS